MKIGLFGLGHLGKIHARCLKATDCWDLVGFYEPNDAVAQAAIEQFEIQRFDTIAALLSAVDAVDIVTPTPSHYALASKAIRAGKHVFIEKPVTETVNQARILLNMAERYQVKVQVGHVERFNPAVLSLANVPLQPMFIECHRLAMFQPRGTDVSVVLDLMIHDLDMVLHLVQSPVKKVHASGVAILSNTPDIANVRLEFENGATANLTASRISMKQMRKMRIFQPDAYISLDFLSKTSEVIRLYGEKSDAEKVVPDNVMEIDTLSGKKYLTMQAPDSVPVNAIQRELETFHEAIVQNTAPIVTLQDGYEALRTAYRILAAMKK